MSRTPTILSRRSPGVVRSVRGGFTLIELLIVIGIIALLVAMAVVVGAKVIEGGRSRATTDVIRTLDTTLGAWQLNARVPLPEFLEVRETATKSQFFPIIDARLAANTDFTKDAVPSALYYSALVMQDQSVATEFRQLDSTFVEFASVPVEDSSGRRETWALQAVDIRDAWGQPMRFVHPAFHGGHGAYWDEDDERLISQRETMIVRLPTSKGGATIPVEYRRSYRPFDPDSSQRKSTWKGDADEGMGVGGRGYFYSAGEDGDPGTRDDNVYSTEPRFPAETRGFD